MAMMKFKALCGVRSAPHRLQQRHCQPSVYMAPPSLWLACQFCDTFWSSNLLPPPRHGKAMRILAKPSLVPHARILVSCPGSCYLSWALPQVFSANIILGIACLICLPPHNLVETVLKSRRKIFMPLCFLQQLAYSPKYQYSPKSWALGNQAYKEQSIGLAKVSVQFFL